MAKIAARAEQNVLLLKACFAGSEKEVDRLIELGADPNFRSPESGVTPLHNSITGNSLECTRTLLSKGANVNLRLSLRSIVDERTRAGHTVLFYVKSAEIARLLIQHGVELNAADQNGVTALMEACIWSRFEVVQELVHAGASLAAVDQHNRTALDYLVEQKAKYENLYKLSGEDSMRVKSEKLQALAELLSKM